MSFGPKRRFGLGFDNAKPFDDGGKHADMAGRVSDPLRAITMRFGIGEAVVTGLAREGITLSWIDGYVDSETGNNTNLGAVAFSHEPSGFIEYIVPMYVFDGDFPGALKKCLASLRARVMKDRAQQLLAKGYTSEFGYAVHGTWCGPALNV